MFIWEALCSEPAELTLTSLVLVHASPTGGRWPPSASRRSLHTCSQFPISVLINELTCQRLAARLLPHQLSLSESGESLSCVAFTVGYDVCDFGLWPAVAFLCFYLSCAFCRGFPVPWSASRSPASRREFRCRRAVAGSSLGSVIFPLFIVFSSLGASFVCFRVLLINHWLFSALLCPAAESCFNTLFVIGYFHFHSLIKDNRISHVYWLNTIKQWIRFATFWLAMMTSSRAGPDVKGHSR